MKFLIITLVPISIIWICLYIYTISINPVIDYISLKGKENHTEAIIFFKNNNPTPEELFDGGYCNSIQSESKVIFHGIKYNSGKYDIYKKRTVEDIIGFTLICTDGYGSKYQSIVNYLSLPLKEAGYFNK